MRSIVTLVLAGLLASAPFAVTAHDYRHRGIDARQHNHNTRIIIGWQHGYISHAERLRLAHQQRRIALIESRYRVDGRLNRAERRHLRHAPAHGSRSIYRHRSHERWLRDHQHR